MTLLALEVDSSLWRVAGVLPVLEIQVERLTAGPTSYANGPLGLARQTTAGATSRFIRDPSGTLVALHAGGGSYYYLLDNQSSVTGLTDYTGNLVNNYSYDPYGNSRAKTEAVGNPYQYTSGYLDNTSYLYKLGQRYYDTNLARFTQTDPSGQEANLYAYTAGDPVNKSDPSGALGGGCQAPSYINSYGNCQAPYNPNYNPYANSRVEPSPTPAEYGPLGAALSGCFTGVRVYGYLASLNPLAGVLTTPEGELASCAFGGGLAVGGIKAPTGFPAT